MLFGEEHHLDLVAMAPIIVTKYINVYKDTNGKYSIGCELYESIEQAGKFAVFGVIATIPITWSEK